MKTLTRFGCCFLVWWHLTAGVCCQPTVNPMVISPLEPVYGENTTLKCTAGDFDPDLHSWVWQKGVNETYFDFTASDRILFSPVEHAFLTFYSQTLTIVGLKESDEATYLCIVVENSTGTFINNGAGALFVNYPSEFPVCSPEGPAEVMIGDSLSCRTVIDERSPDVRASGDPSSLQSGWILISLNDTETGSQLEKKVASIDDERTFVCFSTSDIKALSCKIGPLTVTVDNIITTNLIAISTTSLTAPTVDSYHSTTCPHFITGIALSVLVTVVSICVNLLCFRYDPQRLCQLRRFFSRAETPRPQSDSSNPTELRTDNCLYESSITGPPGDCFQGVSGKKSEVVDKNLTTVALSDRKNESMLSINMTDDSSTTRSADSYMELKASNLDTDAYIELKL